MNSRKSLTRWLARASLVTLGASCFNFDAALDRYCETQQCDGGALGTDSGQRDAGYAGDGGPLTVDGGTTDAGTADASAADAGTLVSDAGPEDAGSSALLCDGGWCLRQRFSLGTTLRALCGASPADVWAVGGDRTWVAYNGNGWVTGTVPRAFSNTWLKSCEVGQQALLVVSGAGVARLDRVNSAWTMSLPLPSGEEALDLYRLDGGQNLVCGSVRWVRRSLHDGGWVEEFRDDYQGVLHALFGWGSSVWAAGVGRTLEGVVLRRTPTGTWYEETLPRTKEVLAGVAVDSSRAFAVARVDLTQDAVLERQVDGGWMTRRSFDSSWWRAVWASSAENVWVGGSDGLWRFDGTRWAQPPLPGFPEEMRVYDILGFGGDDLFVLANSGLVDQLDGGHVFHYVRAQ